jgi:hypothetical protein
MPTLPNTSNVVATSTAGPAPATAATSPSITSVAKSTGKTTKVLTQASYQALATGLQSSFQPTDTFNVPSGALTRDQVIAQLNTVIAAAESTKAARQQWLTAVADEHGTLLDVAPLRQSIRTIWGAPPTPGRRSPSFVRGGGAGRARRCLTSYQLKPEAENLSKGFGAAFPTLPRRLLRSAPNRPGTLSGSETAKNEANRVDLTRSDHFCTDDARVAPQWANRRAQAEWPRHVSRRSGPPKPRRPAPYRRSRHEGRCPARV